MPEGVAEASGGVPRDQRHRTFLDLDPLFLGHALQHGRHLLDGRPAEVEPVAAIDHGREHLLRLGRGQHEDRPRRRLLERLEERVPCLRGEHVRLVEDVDLVAARKRARRPPSPAGRGCRRPSCSRPRPSRSRRATWRWRSPRTNRTPHTGWSSGHRRSSGRRRGSSPCSSCPSRGSRRTGRRGAPDHLDGVLRACARRAPGRRRRRRCGGGGGGRARDL